MESHKDLGSEIQQELWKGEIPISISLAQVDIATVTAPMPYLLKAPRNGYLMTLLNEAIEHFKEFAPPSVEIDNIWLEANGEPVRWDIPLGVIFDILADDNTELPWKLIFHFRNHPSQQIAKFTGLSAIRHCYMHALKESCSIRYGSSREILNLDQESENKLWTGMIEDDFVTHNSVLDGIFASKTVGEKCPIKLYITELGNFVSVPYPFTESERKNLLGDYLSFILPHIFIIDKSEEEDTDHKFRVDESSFNVKLVMQGIEPNLNHPLSWLCRHAISSDGFIYLILHLSRKS